MKITEKKEVVSYIVEMSQNELLVLDSILTKRDATSAARDGVDFDTEEHIWGVLNRAKHGRL